MAERLGTGLQNPLHRFESGSDLSKKYSFRSIFFMERFWQHEVLKKNTLKKGVF